MQRTFIAVTLDYTTGISDSGPGTSARFEVYQNYPNPINPLTNISFGIPERGIMELRLFDITGRLVRMLAKKDMVPGNTHVTGMGVMKLARWLAAGFICID